MTDEPTEGMRLAKFLARAGLGSRRASEKQIKAGKIQVNGQVCTNPATKVDPKKDKVFARPTSHGDPQKGQRWGRTVPGL